MASVLPIALVLVLASVAVWVYRDSQAHVAQGRPVVATIGPVDLDTPEAWALGCLVIFVVCLPLYFAARRIA